jgi:hypothetical protein
MSDLAIAPQLIVRTRHLLHGSTFMPAMFKFCLKFGSTELSCAGYAQFN